MKWQIKRKSDERQSVHPMLQARMYYVDNLGDYREFSKQEVILTENLCVLCTLL